MSSFLGSSRHHVTASSFGAVLHFVLGTFVALVSACGAATSTSADAAEDWTTRPPQPVDMSGYYSPDDEANACELKGPPPITPGDVLVFSDEFLGTQVNPGKWNVKNGFVGFASTSNMSSPANAIVANDSLFLGTDRNPADAAPMSPYVSASLDSRGQFARTYGKIEVRGRFPSAKGVWYALVGRPWTGDYPIAKVEIVNRPIADHTQVYFGHQWASTSVPNNQLSSLAEDADFSQFHTYTIEWRPGSIEWFLDGVSKMRSTGVGVATAPT
jgi:beta-glucanase (GH16 family)